MKKIILLFALVISGAFYQATIAQVSVNVNIGSQPVWGPVGYDYVENYYFPDIDAYYNVPAQRYIYFNGFRWATAAALPSRFGAFDPYRSYKVVINEREPYRRNNYYRDTYSSYRGRQQAIIYNSREPKYFVINNHPEHNRYMANRDQFDRRDNNSFPGRRNDDHFTRDNDGRRNDDNGRFNERNNRNDNNRFGRGQSGNRNNADRDFGRNDNRRSK